MTDERSNIAIRDAITNSRVDQVGEEGNAHLEVVVCDVHDTRRELQDGNLWGDLKFADSVKKTIDRYSSIRVNCNMLVISSVPLEVMLTDQDVVTDTDVSIGPSNTASLINCLLQSPGGSLSFVGRVPVL